MNNLNMVDDAFWNQLRDLIKAYVTHRVYRAENDSVIVLEKVPACTVRFEYDREEAIISDSIIDKFVNDIIKQIREISE